MEDVSRKIKIVIFVVVALMFSTAITYFVVASQSGSEGMITTTEQEEAEEQEHPSVANKISGPRNESIFFTIVAFAYIGVGVWILKNRDITSEGTPYMIAIVGSIALVVFYAATRIIDIPYIGIEEEINPIDILTKCLQVGIIAGSIYVLVLSKKTTQKQIQHKS
jgi:hypothetical protein